MWRWNSREPFLENGYYHIYNRGFNKQDIFDNQECFEKFYKYIVRYLKEFPEIKIVSYCFLPDHFHLILHNTWEISNRISDFMKKLQGSYSIWHRGKHPIEYKQAFFEWRFKSQYLGNKTDLDKTIAYVNFNPLKHEIVSDIKDYKYTSYHQLTSKKKEVVEKYKNVEADELEF